MQDTDKAWQHWGQFDPYFGVLTQEQFSRQKLDASAREQFFESGKRYVDFALQVVHDHLDPNFRPTRALDFGCGVGRLAVPLARVCESVVGVDIAEGMLEEARGNARQQGLSNVTFVKSDSELSAVSGTFDYLNSLIVFQHIPPARGEAFLQRMLDLLRPGGVGALQFTYSYANGAPRSRKALIRAYETVPSLWGFRNLAKGRPFSEPMMQMNEYDLNHLLRILQENGCHDVHLRPTETSSFGSKLYGMIIFFQKRSVETRAYA